MQRSRPKLGLLALSEADSIDVLLEELGKIGWVDGKSFDVVFPAATRDLARLADNMIELLAADVDVVVAQTKPAIVIAKDATKTVPIVMGALNGDPVKEGFVKALDRPGGNITGSYYNVAAGAAGRVTVLAELVPGLRRVGIVFNPDSDASIRLFEELAAAAQAKSLEVVRMPVHGASEVDRTFATAKAGGAQGVVTVTAAEMFAIRGQVAQAQLEHRLPTVMGSIGFPELGGLAKFGPEVPSLWKKMVPTVDRLLKGDAKPADLPLVTVDEFQLDINLKTARRLDLAVPASLLGRAIRVIA